MNATFYAPKLCGEAVENYAHALEFVPNCYKTQKICNKAANTSPSAIQFAPACFNTLYMC